MIIYSTNILKNSLKKKTKTGFDKKKIITTRQINKAWNKLNQAGRIGFSIIPLGNFDGIKDCWKNEDCIIIGSSTAIKDYDLSKLKNKHTIIINHMIEKWDGAEWFICIDDRFFDKTIYNISKFKGKVFVSAKCRILPENDCVRYMSNGNKGKPTADIRHGLWGMLSGAAAINLAIITGAKNIYLLGLDDPKEFIEKAEKQEDKNLNYHVGKYTGEVSTKDYYFKYVRSREGYKNFLYAHDRIIDVCENGQMDWFKQMSLKDFDLKLDQISNKVEVISSIKKNIKPLTICHVMSLNSMDGMGDITRYVINESEGHHVTTNIRNTEFPKADIYLLECMLNQAKGYIEFKRPYKDSKIISLIHSSGNCMPANESDKIIVLTEHWKQYLSKRYNPQKIDVVYPGIDSTSYKKIEYNNKNFGRLTRWGAGKVHPQWNKIMIEVLNAVQSSKAFIVANKPQKIDDERITYITDVERKNLADKIKALSNFSLFADMHYTFVETASLCMLESMASGQCYILFSAVPQYAMAEILGDSGIICDDPEEFKKTIIELLNDEKLKIWYGLKAKERSKEFSVKRMIENYNKIFKEVYYGKGY